MLSRFLGKISLRVMIEYTKCSPGMCDKHALFLIQIELGTFIGKGKLHNLGLFQSEVQNDLFAYRRTGNGIVITFPSFMSLPNQFPIRPSVRAVTCRLYKHW